MPCFDGHLLFFFGKFKIYFQYFFFNSGWRVGLKSLRFESGLKSLRKALDFDILEGKALEIIKCLKFDFWSLFWNKVCDILKRISISSLKTYAKFEIEIGLTIVC